MKKFVVLLVFVMLPGCSSVNRQGECSILHWPHVDVKECNGKVTVVD